MRRTLSGIALLLFISASLRSAAQPSASQPLFVVGSEDGSSGELLSRVGGVAIDLHGRLIVLDAGEHRLVVIKPTGERIQYLARRGAGPGEFLSPMGIAITDKGRLFVVDPQASRLTEFDASSPDSVRYMKDWVLPVRGYALCTAGERVFVQGESNGRLIHEVSFSGGGVQLRSFAELKSHHRLASSPMIRPFMTMGSLACSPNGSFVGFVPRQLGEVRVFHADGTEQLFGKLTPFQEIGVSLVERGIRYDYSTPFFQQNVALLVSDEGAPTVEIVTLRPRGQQRIFPETFEFREMNAKGATRSSVPGRARLAALSPTRVACTREDPFPVVLVFQRRQSSASLCP